ncbi:hypothetical protein [Sediminibacterium sp.]|uniref:hypothetical protein n=1 Tax=Sediminibacterium sp. TaxID=1917865 RepID=UPI003F716703
MKKLLILLLLGFTSLQFVIAQDTWKERADFYEVLNTVLQNAEKGDIDPALSRLDELKSKYSIFHKSIMQIYTTPKEKMRRNAVLLSEHVTYIGLISKKNLMTPEIMYGELLILHGLFSKIRLENDEWFINKTNLKYYEKEEKRYRAKRITF